MCESMRITLTTKIAEQSILMADGHLLIGIVSMQLFITKEYTILNKTLEITDPRVFYQCTKVLRYRKGDRITLQHETNRYVCTIILMNKKSLTTTIETIDHKPEKQSAQSSLVVAMVNKWDKLELIVQKCAEL